jgi:hypothetical protein
MMGEVSAAKRHAVTSLLVLDRGVAGCSVLVVGRWISYMDKLLADPSILVKIQIAHGGAAWIAFTLKWQLPNYKPQVVLWPLHLQ